MTRSLRLEASFVLWEDHCFYISPPHVPNPPKTGALVEVVRDNIVACYLSEGSHFDGVRTCGGLMCKWSSHNAIGYIAKHPFIINTICSRYTMKSLLRVGCDNIFYSSLFVLFSVKPSYKRSPWQIKPDAFLRSLGYYMEGR